MFKLEFGEKKQTLYASALTYGIPAQIVIESETLRNIFGRHRYTAVAVKKFLSLDSLPTFESDVFYEEKQSRAQTRLTPTKLKKKSLSSDSKARCSINTPKSFETMTKSDLEETNKIHDWKKLEHEEFLYYAIVTHEIRSSMSKEVMMPTSRVNDGKMHIFGLKRASKLEAIDYQIRSAEGAHFEHPKFFQKSVTALKIKNPEGSYFCADGEAFHCNEYEVTLKPGIVNLMGKVMC